MARLGNLKRLAKLASVTALASILGGGCSTSSDTGQPGGDGGGDRTSNGSIRIDEAALSGTASEGKVSIDIPVEALTSHASGSLKVSLRVVDCSKTF